MSWGEGITLQILWESVHGSFYFCGDRTFPDMIKNVKLYVPGSSN